MPYELRYFLAVQTERFHRKQVPPFRIYRLLFWQRKGTERTAEASEQIPIIHPLQATNRF